MSVPNGDAPATPRPCLSAGAERMRLVEQLHHVVASINVETDLDAVLERICATTTELAHADAAAFLLLDGEHWRPTVLCRDQRPEQWAPVPVDALAGVAVDQQRSAFLVDELEPEVRDTVRSALPGAYAGAVAAPRTERASGVLVALYGPDRRVPRAVELEVLGLLAEHAGVAIINAHRYAYAVRQRGRQHAIVDATADGLAVLDDDGRILQWNRSAARLTGVSARDVLGQPMPFPTPLSGQVLDHRLPDGRWLEILCSNVPDSTDRVVDFRDVSQTRELDEAKDLFLATAGHELRTPITAIQGFASTLLRRWSDLPEADRRRAVEVMAERSGALAKLVDKVMLGSTVGQHDVELTDGRVNLETLLHNVVAGFAPPSGDHRIGLDLGGGATSVWGDPLALDQVAAQLLENAIKFSPEGGAVTVRTWVGAEQAGFSVLDRGVGIDSSDLDRMFELFYQSGAGERRRFGGMGLGLYIVRQLLRAQHGAVSAHQRTGGGLEVRVALSRVEPDRGETAGLEQLAMQASQ